jgi:hypothetical protein
VVSVVVVVVLVEAVAVPTEAAVVPVEVALADLLLKEMPIRACLNTTFSDSVKSSSEPSSRSLTGHPTRSCPSAVLV